MRRTVIAMAGLLVALGVMVSGCEREQAGGEGAAEQQRVTMKMASSFAATVPIIGDTGPYFSQRLEDASGGRIQIRFFDPGKLIPALEIFDSVSNGAVDAGWSSAGYWIGKLPVAALFAAVPFGPDTGEYMAWMFEGGGVEMWREIYGEHNMWVTPCVMIPPEASGWFRQPITSVSQLEGMKIRFFGLGGKAVQKLGASVQLLAGGDIFPALERGVLDATEFSMPSIDERYGFQKIAKHYYFPGWHQQASIVELMINLDRWNELSKQDQTLIEMTCKDSIIRGITLGEVQQGQALENIQAEGVQLHTWNDEMLAAFKKASLEVLEEEAAADPQFKRVWESLKSFRADYNKWAELSRIPADMR